VRQERVQAERFAELFRAVYLTFHRRDGPRNQLAAAMARLPPGRADDLIAGLRALVDEAAPAPGKTQEDLT
jgi:hypothetical protein